MTKRQQAVTYFVGQGWTPAQAAGIVANLEAESSLNPAAVGDGGKAYGIAQWHPDRQAYFSVAIGGDIRGSSFEQQLAFVHAELTSTEKRAGDLLRACTTPAEAGAVVSKRYERPADAEGEAAKRAKLAETIFREFITEVETQPAAPIEDRGRPYNPEQEAPMFPLLIPLAGALIQAFAPLAREKISAEMNRHTTDKTIGDQIATSVIEAAKSLTGKSDPIEAVAAAKADPAIVQKVQERALDDLAKLGPVFDKIAQFDKDAWAADESSKAAAADRSRTDTVDLATPLTYAGLAAIGVLILFVGAIIIVQLATKGSASTEAWAALTGLIGWVTGQVSLIYAYRFGTTRTSGAKDVIISELARK